MENGCLGEFWGWNVIANQSQARHDTTQKGNFSVGICQAIAYSVSE
jgi:hypothetical protein